MRTFIFSFIIILSQTFAQWLPDVRLTNNPGGSYTSYNNARCIAASGDTVQVVWFDDRDGNAEIYYKRSTNGGIVWGSDTRLTVNSSNSWNPSVSVSGSTIHVVWYDNRDGNFEIYFKRSTDVGMSWSSDIRLTSNSATSQFPSLSVSGLVVHVVWDDVRDGNYEIYYKRSSDGGISWGTDSRLTNNAEVSSLPSVSASGSVVSVVWFDSRDGNDEIYYKRSTDGGISWGADTRLTSNPAHSSYPSVSVSGSFVHVMWEDDRNGNMEIYYKRSTDGGSSWSVDTRLTNHTSDATYPSISVSGLFVHVVWSDVRDGNLEVYYERSTDGGISWGIDTRLTSNAAGSYYPSVLVSGSIVHVVWRDNRDGNFEIYYKRDPTGNPFGIKIISLQVPKVYSLSQNYPNPFNPATKIRFALLKSSFAKIVVYDALGREIETIVNEQLNAGTYEVDWNAANYTSGIYYYKIEAASFVETKKMILIK